MNDLNWELSLLRRAVAYSNLTNAAAHVGVSQPQLSRIVSRLESELGLSLLDRSAKRKSGWTPSAYRLAELYNETTQRFQGELQKLVKGGQPSHVRIGTLEGLTSIAVEFAHGLMKTPEIHVIELMVLDLNELEERFAKRDLELILTSREPGRKKFAHSRRLGYQLLERVGGATEIHVMSSFEYGSQSRSARAHDERARVVVSNSLEVRRLWIERFGGTGILPSPVRKTRPAAGKDAVEASALLLGADELPTQFWKRLLEIDVGTTVRA